LDESDAYFGVRELIEEFTNSHGGQYTIAFNGRSSGYLVLYKSYLKPTGYKSFCLECGQKNYEEIVKRGDQDVFGKCGRCGAQKRVNLKHLDISLSILCGKEIGGEEHEWNEDLVMDENQIDYVNNMYQLIKDFDECVDKCIASFLDFVATHKFVEEEVIETRKVKVCVSKEDEE
jgi:hypothetical protein